MRIRYKFLVFGLVGVGAFIIDFLIFNAFFAMGINFSFSITLGWIFSMIFNFPVNTNLTFSAKGSSIVSQMIKWVFVYAFAFLARLLLSRLILAVLEEGVLNANIAFLGGFAVSVPIAFLGSLLWAFKKKS